MRGDTGPQRFHFCVLGGSKRGSRDTCPPKAVSLRFWLRVRMGQKAQMLVGMNGSAQPALLWARSLKMHMHQDQGQVLCLLGGGRINTHLSILLDQT